MVATVLTVYGIETEALHYIERPIYQRCNSTYRLRYWNTICNPFLVSTNSMLQQYLPFTVLKRIFCKINSSHDYPPELQQYLPFTVCDKGCEIAEGQSDDEVRTSLVPDRREGKTKVIR